MKPTRLQLAVIFTLWSPALSLFAGENVVHFDFEDGNVQGWKVVAGEFPNPVCTYGNPDSGNLPKRGRGSGYLSTSGLAAGKEGPDPDRMGGIIESPVFVIRGKEATFLLGGVAAQATLNTVDGRQVRKSSPMGPR